LGAVLVVDALDLAVKGLLQATAQATDGVTYAHKIEKHEAAIRWSDEASAICRRVRAFNPFPGATATLQGETIKIWRATPAVAQANAAPGTVLAVDAAGIAVAAAGGAVLLQELQRPGGKRLPVADFLRGFVVQPGMQFAVTAPDPAASAG
jgi:methionyl-tRNA formyltransferase